MLPVNGRENIAPCYSGSEREITTSYPTNIKMALKGYFKHYAELLKEALPKLACPASTKEIALVLKPPQEECLDPSASRRSSVQL